MKAFGLAWREMIRRRRGVLVNLLLVVCVVSILVAVWTLREAMLQRVRRVTAQMGNNLLFIPATASIDSYYAAQGPQVTMPQEKAEYLATQCPIMSKEATHYVAKYQNREKINDGEAILTGFKVVGQGQRGGQPGRSGQGPPGAPGQGPPRRRSFLDDPLPKGQVIVGSEAARRCKLTEGATFDVAGHKFTVKGVLPEFGVLDDVRIWARLEEVQNIYDAAGKIHGVDALGCFCEGPYLDSINKEVAERFPEFRLLHSEMIARTRINMRVAVEDLGLLIVAIVSILGAIAIFATTAAEVRERRNELGVLQAMGAGSGQLFMLLLPKILVSGLAGGLIGWGLGSLLAVWVGPALSGGMEQLVFRMMTELIPIAAAMGTVLAALAGGIAVWRGSRLDPVDALREL